MQRECCILFTNALLEPWMGLSALTIACQHLRFCTEKFVWLAIMSSMLYQSLRGINHML